MWDLIGAGFGFGLLIFGLATGRDNHVLVGTLTAIVMLVLYFQGRKGDPPSGPDDPE